MVPKTDYIEINQCNINNFIFQSLFDLL